MACNRSCTSLLPHIWVIEALACSSEIDVSLLMDLLEKIPEIPQDLARDAREFISLRVLECLFVQRTHTDSASSARSRKIRLDPSEHCEDVLRRILAETSASNPKLAGPEIWKWDLQPFMERKRSRLAKHALGQLKDAIVTGSNSLLSSLREQSGLPVGKKPEHGVPVDNSTAPRLEGSNGDGSYLVQKDCTDESLLPISRKRRATTGDVGEQSWICEDISKNGKTHTEIVKKNRLEIIVSEKDAGGNVASPGADTQIADASNISVLHDDGERCIIIEKANIGGMGLKGPAGNDNNECTFVKGFVGLDEVSLHEKQVPADSELNHKHEDELKQDDQIKEAKGDQEGVSELKTVTEDVDQLEPSNQINNPCIGEVEEEDDISSDSDVNDHDRTGVATKINPSFSYQSEDTPDSPAATDWRDLNVLADASKKVVEWCRAGKVTHVGDMGQSESPGCHDERTYINAKKKTFLSSQPIYSQDSLDLTDGRQLNLCVKCHTGGKLLLCNARSCPMVIHDSCLGSETSVDIAGKFYCPFCAYSRAISEFTELKKKSALARKNLETFIHLEARKKIDEKTHKSANVDQNKLKRDDGMPKSKRPNSYSRDFNREASNCQPGKRSEYEHVEPSGLNSRYSIDSSDGVPRASNKDKQEGKRARQVCHSQRTCGQHTVAAQAAQAENTPDQVPDRSDRRKHAEIGSKKGVLHPPETDLPCESEGARSTKAAEKEDVAAEEESSSGSKDFLKIQKRERHSSYPANHQLRRIRIRWTSAEEEKLKEGIKLFCKPEDNIIPWTQILEFGAGTFHTKRSAIDLKDKWRNICKATTPKP